MGKPERVYNVFDALNLPASEEVSARAELAAKIIDVIRERGYSYDDAAREIGCTAIQG